MNWQTFLSMRHEILVTVLILYQLIADLTEKENKHRVVNATIVMFALITIVGYLPSSPARMFGNMFVTDDMRMLLKNVLTGATMIILLQSSGWLSKPEHSAKAGSFYLLLFSTLLGMFFMVSAGDFLMLYLGLELATIPLTILAALDKKVRRSAEAGIKLLMSSAVSSAVLLFGLSLIYGVYGTLHFSEIALLRDGSSVSILALIFFM